MKYLQVKSRKIQVLFLWIAFGLRSPLPKGQATHQTCSGIIGAKQCNEQRKKSEDNIILHQDVQFERMIRGKKDIQKDME